ncbi:hypothetical protein D3C80_1749410 [compost metagenome]
MYVMQEPGSQRAAQQAVAVHRLELHQRAGQLIRLPAAAQAIQQYRQHQILIVISALLPHPLLADHHGGARGAIGTGDAARPGEVIAERDAHPQSAALIHPRQQIIHPSPVIFRIPSPMAIERRFQHHHFTQ